MTNTYVRKAHTQEELNDMQVETVRRCPFRTASVAMVSTLSRGLPVPTTAVAPTPGAEPGTLQMVNKCLYRNEQVNRGHRANRKQGYKEGRGGQEGAGQINPRREVPSAYNECVINGPEKLLQLFYQIRYLWKFSPVTCLSGLL